MAKQKTGRKKQREAPATLTIEEAAKVLKIGRNQCYEAAHRGDIPAFRIGTRWLVPTAELNRKLGERV
jgi:excisionase family DNA binding protein